MAGKSKIYGFGFNPEEAHHHFLVYIAGIKPDESVYIFEYYEWEENRDVQQSVFELEQNPACRVRLTMDRWKGIAEEVRAEFNRRLQDLGLKTGKWKTGLTPVNREMGKELVLLAWSIEEAETARIPYALKNWLGLSREERWWLFTMTNAATGQALNHRGMGWRKAVRYALTENPVIDVVEKRTFNLLKIDEKQNKPKTKNRKKSLDKKQLSLFDINESG